MHILENDPSTSAFDVELEALLSDNAFDFGKEQHLQARVLALCTVFDILKFGLSKGQILLHQVIVEVHAF